MRDSLPLGAPPRLTVDNNRGCQQQRHQPFTTTTFSDSHQWKSLVTRASSAFAAVQDLSRSSLPAMSPPSCSFSSSKASWFESCSHLREVRKEKAFHGWLQQWYFYGTAVFFTYGRFLKHKWLESSIVKAPERLGAFGLFMFAHHSFISYIGWMVGLVLFVHRLIQGSLSLPVRTVHVDAHDHRDDTHAELVFHWRTSSRHDLVCVRCQLYFSAARGVCAASSLADRLSRYPEKTWEGLSESHRDPYRRAFAAAWIRSTVADLSVDDKSRSVCLGVPVVAASTPCL